MQAVRASGTLEHRRVIVESMKLIYPDHDKISALGSCSSKRLDIGSRTAFIGLAMTAADVRKMFTAKLELAVFHLLFHTAICCFVLGFVGR